MMRVHHSAGNSGTFVSTLMHCPLLGGKNVIFGPFLGGNIPRKPNVVLGEPQKIWGWPEIWTNLGASSFSFFFHDSSKKRASRRPFLEVHWEEIIQDMGKPEQENSVSRSSGQSNFQQHFMTGKIAFLFFCWHRGKLSQNTSAAAPKKAEYC